MSTGGWNSTGRTEADRIKKISAHFLKENGYFKGWWSGTITWTNGWSGTKSGVGIEISTMNEEKYLRIYYTQTDNDSGEKKDFDYKIPLITTPCNYGGKRYWFRCPMSRSGQYCGRRVSTLYKNGDYFACRHCHNLTYASRNASARYKGFVNILDLDEMEAKVKRTHYAGKPTRKYKQLLRMEEQLERSFIALANNLQKRTKSSKNDI